MSPLLEKALILLGSAIVALAFSNIILWSLNIGKVELYDHDPDYGYLTKPDQWPSPRGIISDCLLKTAAVFRERNNLTRLRDATSLKLRSTPGRHTM